MQVWLEQSEQGLRGVGNKNRGISCHSVPSSNPQHPPPTICKLTSASFFLLYKSRALDPI